MTASYALVDEDEQAESGICDLCGQELIRTATDCWHPYTVERACPPEPGDDWSQETGWPAFYRQYRGPGRPGREHFVEATL